MLEDHPVLKGQRGLQARRDLDPHEIIAHYRGTFFSPEAFRQRYGHFSIDDWSSLASLQYLVDVQTLDDGEPVTRGHLDAYTDDGPSCRAAFANHSGRPNAQLVTRTLVDTDHGDDSSAVRHEYQVFLVATAAIPAGHEILVNYGGEYQAELEAAVGYEELTPTTHLEMGAGAPGLAPSTIHAPGPAQPSSKRKAAAAKPAGSGAAEQAVAKNKRARVDEDDAPPHRRAARSAACAECSAGFDTDHQLILHGQAGGCMPFQCGVKGCSERFKHNNSRLRHERTTHSLQNQHTCDRCGHTFARKDGLSRHLKAKRCKPL